MIKMNYELLATNLTGTNECELIRLVKNEEFFENFNKIDNVYTVHLKNSSGTHDYVLFKIKKFGSYWKMSYGTLDASGILGNYICEDIVDYDKFNNERSLKGYIEKVCKIIEEYYR